MKISCQLCISIWLIVFWKCGQEIIDAKVFTQCQLASELIKQQFQRSFIPNWDCLVEHESGRNTSKVTQLPNLTNSYGLFQINSKNWCGQGRKAGECNINCLDLLNDDISDDSKCAKIIFNRGGFQAWNMWVRKCRGKNLPSIPGC